MSVTALGRAEELHHHWECLFVRILAQNMGFFPGFPVISRLGNIPAPNQLSLSQHGCRCWLSITCLAPASPILSCSGTPRIRGKKCSSNVFQKCQHSSICISRQTDLSVTNYSSLQHSEIFSRTHLIGWAPFQIKSFSYPSPTRNLWESLILLWEEFPFHQWGCVLFGQKPLYASL